MTSDIPVGTISSTAQRQLDIAFGSEHISLSALTSDELDTFLYRLLKDVETRHLRGFRPLRCFLRVPSSHEPIVVQPPIVEISGHSVGINMDTQMHSLSRCYDKVEW